jgi:uncharacterized protein (DUF1697 family)
MADLRAGLEQAGFEDVATYIQSGNIVMRSGLDSPAIARAVSDVIADRFELDIPVVVRSGDELTAVIEANPFPDMVDQPKFLHVFFSPSPLGPNPLDGFDADAHEPDRIASAGNEVYVAYNDGMSNSKLDNKVVDRQLGVATTARNWNTVTKLAQMIAAA